MTREEIREHCNAYGYSDEEVGAFLDGIEYGKAEAIDECIKLIGGNIKSIVGTYNKDTPLTDRASYRVAKNELIEELVKQLEQLKEQNNDRGNN